MQHQRLAVSTIAATGLAALLAMTPAHAVPCGAYNLVGGIKTGSTDLGASSATCRNAVAGDANDSVEDLNTGAFFGSSSWTLLTRTADGTTGDSQFWTYSNVANSNTSGTFSLASGLWSLYSKLVVVLKDGGSTTNRDIKWSAYLLPNGINGAYTWSYDRRKQLSHATLYGIKGRTSVPEPASLAVLGIGLAGAAFALRRKLARQS